MAKKKATTAKKELIPKTTAQQLGSLIKSARDIMRKDKGLNGDLDRLPLLTWVMFLKFLDDREKLEEARAGIGGKKYKSAVDAPYRWRDWAANKDGITGDELIVFVNQDEATRPDGTKGPGLLAYLRSLQSTAEDRRRGVIATVFNGVNNRMLSGYLLRDVINLVDGIHFDSTDEIHTLARLYESMLREMRDAAGDSGEFYTPRPVVQFMVKAMNPQLGEVVLDPACGTGGFLSETFEHLEKQCTTVQHRKMLQERSINGGEAKPLPYMLSQMNLLLHGLNAPAIEYGNSLTVKITELGANDRVDVILTNPPFGGEEEAGIRNNFPADKQTSETALLFLQLIMRKLRKPSGSNTTGGRAAVVVPNGTLFGDGVCARIKEELLREFNLHTIIRLPGGVFAPYTDIPTNLLFFDRSGPTKDIWFYEVSPPEGRKKYSKTKPLQLEELADCLKWFQQKKRKSGENTWRVSARDILVYDLNKCLVSCNLDSSNPLSGANLVRIPPTELLATINSSASDSALASKELMHVLQELGHVESDWVEIGDIAELIKRPAEILSGEIVRSIGVKWWGKGVQIAEEKPADDLRAARFFVRHNDLVYNDMWARHGSVGIVPKELCGSVASAHFPTWELDQSRVVPDYLSFVFKSPWFWADCENKSQGSTGRNAITKTLFRKIKVPLPTVAEQSILVEHFASIQNRVERLRLLQSQIAKELEALFPSILDRAFRGEL
jgi:type I restriction enzyme M protein